MFGEPRLNRLSLLRIDNSVIPGSFLRRTDSRQPLEERSSRVVQLHRRLPLEHASDGFRQMSYRIISPWPRPMAGRSGRSQRHAARNLLRRRYFQIPNLPVCRVDESTFCQRVLRFNVVPVILDKEVDTDPRRALLTCFRHIDHIAIEGHVETLQLKHKHQSRGHHILVVCRAAAPDETVLHHGAERIDRPLFALDADRVRVAQNHDRPLAAISFQPCDEVAPTFIQREHLVRNTLAIENRLHIVHDLCLIARRIRRIDPNNRLKML